MLYVGSISGSDVRSGARGASFVDAKPLSSSGSTASRPQSEAGGQTKTTAGMTSSKVEAGGGDKNLPLVQKSPKVLKFGRKKN